MKLWKKIVICAASGIIPGLLIINYLEGKEQQQAKSV